MDEFWPVLKELLIVIGILINGYVVLRLNKVSSDVKTIVVHTNSMREALVAATAEASLAEGKSLGRAASEAEELIRADAVKEAKAAEAAQRSPAVEGEIRIEDVDAIKLKKEVNPK